MAGEGQSSPRPAESVPAPRIRSAGGLRHGVALLAGVLLALTATWWLQAGERAGVARFDTGSVAETAAAQSNARRRVSLPSIGHRDCPGCELAWYEIDVVAPFGSGQDAVLLTRVVGVVSVYLNGELLAAELRPAAGAYAGGPVLLDVPPAALQGGQDRLTVRLAAQGPGRFALGPVLAGSSAELSSAYRFERFMKPALYRFAAALSAVVAILLAALWAQRMRRREYGYMALMALLLAVICADSALSGDVYVPGLRAGTLGLLAAAAGRFACVASGRPVPRLVHLCMPAAIAFVILLAGAAALAGGAPQGLVAGATVLWLAALAGFQAPLLVYGPRAFTAARWPIGAVGLLAVCALIDAWASATPGPAASLVGAAAPVYALTFAWLLLTHFFDGVRRTEAINEELDRLVMEKTHKIEDQYRAMSEMEQQRILAGERERILQDMHDGLGGQLVSALAIIDRERDAPGALRETLVEALTDMRLMIDSLDAVDEDLNAVLAMFRDRMNPRLAAAGIELRWQVDDLPALAGLGPSGVLGILRIMQECVTNTLKHANARRIDVIARDSDQGAQIVLADDGCGFDPAAPNPAGHGLTGLKKRAAEHNVRLDITSAPGKGTQVQLTFPRSGVSASPTSAG